MNEQNENDDEDAAVTTVSPPVEAEASAGAADADADADAFRAVGAVAAPPPPGEAENRKRRRDEGVNGGDGDDGEQEESPSPEQQHDDVDAQQPPSASEEEGAEEQHEEVESVDVGSTCSDSSRDGAGTAKASAAAATTTTRKDAEGLEWCLRWRTTVHTGAEGVGHDDRDQQHQPRPVRHATLSVSIPTSSPSSSPTRTHLLCLTGRGTIRRMRPSSFSHRPSAASASGGAGGEEMDDGSNDLRSDGDDDDGTVSASVDGYPLTVDGDGGDREPAAAAVEFDSPIWGGSWATLRFEVAAAVSGRGNSPSGGDCDPEGAGASRTEGGEGGGEGGDSGGGTGAAGEDEVAKETRREEGNRHLLHFEIRPDVDSKDQDVRVWSVSTPTPPPPSIPTGAGSETNDRDLFIRHAKVRPTIVPPSWLEASDAVLEDYHRSSSCCCEVTTPPPNDPSGCGSPPSSSSSPPLFTVIVVGARGTGKTTFLRYLTNRILGSRLRCRRRVPPPHQHPRGCWLLDGDCAYPQYGPPGTLALEHVTEPLLHAAPVRDGCSSNHSCRRRMLFFGATTPSTDPSKYMECIHELRNNLLEQLASEGSGSDSADSPHQSAYDIGDGQPPDTTTAIMPVLLIHLPAFLQQKGLLGEQLLQALVAQTNAQRLVKILNTETARSQLLCDKRQPFEEEDVGDVPLDQLEFAAGAATFRQHDVYAFNYYPDSDNYIAPSSSQATVQAAPALSTPIAALRLHWIASHFLPDEWDEVLWSKASAAGVGGLAEVLNDGSCTLARALASHLPYVVPFESVEWGLASVPEDGSDFSESGMLDVMNGAIVGLLHRSDENFSSSGGDDHHLLPCIGLGLIRSIDRIKRLFYVLTPVPQEVLQAEVNVISVGSIELPLECYFRGVESEGFVYQSLQGPCKPPEDILGADPMKSRNNIGRKSLMSKQSL